jgi:hypothetical protein
MPEDPLAPFQSALAQPDRLKGWTCTGTACCATTTACCCLAGRPNVDRFGCSTTACPTIVP